MNLNYYYRLLLLSPLVAVISTTSVHASLIVIDQIGTANDNNVASGRVTNDGSTTDLANWTLTSTVSNTDWTNQNVQGGSQGLEYHQRNDVLNSSEINRINFSLSLLGGNYTGLKIFQSPYNNGTGWNGGSDNSGSNITSKFIVSWAGGGVATISDDADQLLGLATGDTISSGTEINFSSGQVLNNVDGWGISLTSAITDVTIDWSAKNPTPGDWLYNEWVSFDPTISEVPLPAAVWLFGFGLLGLAGIRKKSNIIP